MEREKNKFWNVIYYIGIIGIKELYIDSKKIYDWQIAQKIGNSPYFDHLFKLQQSTEKRYVRIKKKILNCLLINVSIFYFVRYF